MNKPVITIRGQMEAGAEAVGEALAGLLGAAFVDRQVPHMIARALDVPAEDVEWLEAPPVTLWERLLRGAALGAAVNPLMPSSGLLFTFPGWRPPLGLHRYREALEAVVREASWHASVVIKGRGSQFILKDRPEARHVLLLAPLRERAGHLSASAGIPWEEAKKHLLQADRALAGFIKRLFGADLWDPRHYDLVLRMDNLTPVGAAQVILQAVSQANQGRGLRVV